MADDLTATGTDRRDFIRASLATLAAAPVLGAAGFAQGANTSGNDVIKVGLIGCGGRGGGAARDALEADPRVKIVALGDVFDDRLNGAHDSLKGQFKDRVDVGDRKYLGFDAYKKVLAQDVTYVILATPPHFRPDHFAAAVAAKKHVFMEKPVAVDPVGCRKVIEAGEKAKADKLSVVAGTQRRHQQGYVEQADRIKNGEYGKILGGQVYWCDKQLWYKTRESNWSDLAWMIRDWVNWRWLSGDHIVEQHVHNIDIANWFIGTHPTAATGYGGRVHRVTGDQFDFFSVDFEYPEGVHVASYCRQINDTFPNVSETLAAEKGMIYGGSSRGGRGGKKGRKVKSGNPYVQEHVDLIDSIVHGKGLNEANAVATSTLSAVMGRIAAYTGKKVTWDEMMKSDLRLGPTDYSWDMKLPPVEIPRPGRA